MIIFPTISVLLFYAEKEMGIGGQPHFYDILKSDGRRAWKINPTVKIKYPKFHVISSAIGGEAAAYRFLLFKAFRLSSQDLSLQKLYF